MDTPEKNQIITPVSKFEDSPVFNYINNLSPIKPVKSVHITQTLNALSFSSLPSIFTSPHVSSLKESRFLRRHNVSDPSNTQNSSENGKKIGANEEFRSIEHSQKFDDCGSPTACCGIETKCFSQSVCTSTSLVPFGQEISDKGLFGSKLPLEGIRHIAENKGGAVCDWETLISDASDLLIFNSPNGAVALNSQNFTNDDLSDFQKTQAGGSGEQHERENLSTQPEEGSDLKEIDETLDILADASMNNCITGAPSENMGDEHVPHFQRGMRRRCLVFEIMGGRRQYLDDSSSSGLPVLPHLDDSRMCVLPGIGLHLNAIATTSKDKKVVTHGTLASSQEPLDQSLGAPSFERDMCSSGNELQAIEEAPQAPGYIVSEESNQISPIKKRRRLENGGDTEGCKRCNCKKSKCLKLYCECFAAGIYCVEPCSCQECFNKPIYEDTVLATRKQIESRNPLAFAPKVIRSSDSTAETRDESSKTPASARHKRGCNCKKSGCLKKYCECYQGGVGCSINCRCEACKNVFGRKDGAESEQEEEEMETWENSLVDKTSQRTALPNEAEQNPDYAIPETPLRFGRSSVQLPFPKGKPPRSSSSLSIGSSSGLYSSQRFQNPNLLQPQSKFEKQFQTIHEDEMPEILQENISPISGIKTSSPNSKRVSPTHCELGFSPGGGRRSSRKLILQSIRSFPSLTHNH